jgi:hypothetical protein
VLAALPGEFARQDRSGTGDPAAHARETFAALEPDAVVLSTWGTSTVLWHLQWVEGLNRGVQIANAEPIHWQRIASQESKRPRYCTRVPPGARPEAFRPVGVLWRIVE